MKTISGVKRRIKTKYLPYVRETKSGSNVDLQDNKVVVHVSKDENAPMRILGGNHQHQATLSAEDAL